MSEQHRATPDMWAMIESLPLLPLSSCILELRARVEALEAASRRDGAPVYGAYNEAGELQGVVPASAFPAPAGSLVERVGDVFLCKSFSTDDPLGARAVLHEVAAAARSRDMNGQSIAVMTWEMVARWLEQEATR